jgi:hypothetical protein
MYTWGPSNLGPADKIGKMPEKSVIESLDVFRPLRKKGQGSRRTLEYHDKSSKGPTEKVTHYVLKGISCFNL